MLTYDVALTGRPRPWLKAGVDAGYLVVGLRPGTDARFPFALSLSGDLTFRNEAVRYDLTAPPTEYRIRWAWFDNDSQAVTPIGEESLTTTPAATAPAAIRQLASTYLRIEVRTIHPDYPAWATPVYAFFRREGPGWRAVGLERME